MNFSFNEFRKQQTKQLNDVFGHLTLPLATGGPYSGWTGHGICANPSSSWVGGVRSVKEGKSGGA